MRRLIITLTMLLSVMAASGRDFQMTVTDTLTVAELQEKQARKDSLYLKYGKEYGALLAEDKIDLGMTKEMCMVVLDRECFIIRSKMDDKGNKYEEWRFDLEKTMGFIKELYKDTPEILMIIAQLEQMSSGAFSDGLKQQVPYKFLKFKNGILIEFLENA